MTQNGIFTALLLVSLSGCSFYARGADDYRKATRALLDTKQSEVQGCYAAEVKENAKAKGTVTVRFDVAPKTGKVENPTVVDDKTTGNKQLQKCVLDSLEGLVLEPPDQRKGEATFTWEFNR